MYDNLLLVFQRKARGKAKGSSKDQKRYKSEMDSLFNMSTAKPLNLSRQRAQSYIATFNLNKLIINDT